MSSENGELYRRQIEALNARDIIDALFAQLATPEARSGRPARTRLARPRLTAQPATDHWICPRPGKASAAAVAPVRSHSRPTM